MAETIELTVGDVTTTALVGVPSGAGPFPGVVATFHREGLDDFTAWLIDDLNAHGYAAIAPNHYHALPQGVSIDRRREFLTDEQMSLDIKAAVEQLFSVKVKAVNTIVRKGKVKKFRNFLGKRKDVKKAIVTLVDGQTIDISTGL